MCEKNGTVIEEEKEECEVHKTTLNGHICQILTDDKCELHDNGIFEGVVER